MTNCPYSPGTYDLIGLVPHSPQSSLPDGAWCINTGETRWYIRHDGRHWWALTRTDRGSGEEFVISAPNMTDIERYLTDVFGSEVRSRRKWPYFAGAGYTPAGLKPGYTLAESVSGNVVLADPHGTVRAVVHGDLVSGTYDAVELSWLMDHSLGDLRASFLDPDGLPLFPGLQIMQPSPDTPDVEG